MAVLSISGTVSVTCSYLLLSGLGRSCRNTLQEFSLVLFFQSKGKWAEVILLGAGALALLLAALVVLGQGIFLFLAN